MGGLKRSGVDSPLCSSRACLHTAFIAISVHCMFDGDGGGGDSSAGGLLVINSNSIYLGASDREDQECTQYPQLWGMGQGGGAGRGGGGSSHFPIQI